MSYATPVLGGDVHLERGPVLVTDLLCGAETLAERLRDALRDEQWLDAYLLAAGLGQMVDDRLHADPLLFHRAASYLRGKPSRQARLAAAAAGNAGKLCAVVRAGGSPAARRLTRVRRASWETPGGSPAAAIAASAASTRAALAWESARRSRAR